MPKSILEPAEYSKIHALLNLAGEHVAQRAVHGGARGLRPREQEWQVADPELRHPIGQVARGLITQRQQAMLDQPQDILGTITEVHDVPDVFNLHTVAELGLK